MSMYNIIQFMFYVVESWEKDEVVFKTWLISSCINYKFLNKFRNVNKNTQQCLITSSLVSIWCKNDTNKVIFSN